MVKPEDWRLDIDAYYAKRMAAKKVQESIDAQEAKR